jgi:molybdenum ABC transporter, periplasmic molybdate-binding protein
VRRHPPVATAAVALVATSALLALLAGCGSGSKTASTGSAASSSPAAGTLTVYAAASLKPTFTELGATFTKENPGTTVNVSFAGSSDLVANLIGGAPGDVFASADVANMTKATDAGLVTGDPTNFATNTLVIVTPPTNPAGIASFADLAKPGVVEVVCAPQVPCGAAAKKIEDTSGVTLSPASEESSVTDVLGKVISGDAQAGLVYVTDARSAGDKVETIDFPESKDAVNTYPIAALKSSTSPTMAATFVALVTGPEGRKVLKTAGFAPAP